MPIRITIKEGQCQGRINTVGQTFIVENTTPAGMCQGAWNSIAPYVTALRCGANFPWEDQEGYALIHCPDPQGITLELRRISQ